MRARHVPFPLYFNPRAPRGARLSTASTGLCFTDFNPRAPRGARRRPLRNADLGQDISIHALREERDCAGGGEVCGRSDFNPRAPRGARHGSVNAYDEAGLFQSTRSARSATEG